MIKIKKSAHEITLTLEQKLAAIGCMISVRELKKSEIETVDIEETISDCILALPESLELPRWLNPLVSWIQVHGSVVIIEKLVKILSLKKTQREKIEFSALLGQYAFEAGHKRWKVLLRFAPKKKKTVGREELTSSLIKIRGEDTTASKAGFLVPRETIVPKKKWVLAAPELAQYNRQFRNRLVYGAQWRSDIITAIELGARTPTEISRISGASYEPCHRVHNELVAAGVFEDLKKIS